MKFPHCDLITTNYGDALSKFLYCVLGKKRSYLQFNPFVQQSTVIEFTKKARSCNCVSRIPHFTFPAGYITKVVVSLFTQNGTSTHQWHGLLVLGPGVLQVPELDVPVAGRDEVVPVLGEADGFDFGRDLVGGHLDVVVPVPHVDNHVLLRPHGHHVLAVGGKGHHVHPVLVSGKFGNLRFFLHVPYSDAGGVAALPRDEVSAILREGQGGDGFTGGIDNMTLSIFTGVI